VIRFVLDASFAISWVVEDERTPQGARLFDALKQEKAEAVVPALWADEVANVLLTLERSKKLTASNILMWCEVFLALPIEVKAPSMQESMSEVRSLALSEGLTAYDARYLYLAMQEDLPLATHDRALTTAAQKLGVKLVEKRA
jgi:predicted nucleic acid-binding protein